MHDEWSEEDLDSWWSLIFEDDEDLRFDHDDSSSLESLVGLKEEGWQWRWLYEVCSSDDLKVCSNDNSNMQLCTVLVDLNLDDMRWVSLLESASRALVHSLENETEVMSSYVNVEWDECEDEGGLSSLGGK